VALARAFVAKAVLDLPTTEALIDRLKADRALRRICGFERFRTIPDAARFSRVFAECTALELPARVHEASIRSQRGDRIIGHVARDATEIAVREKPAPKVKPVPSCEAPAEPKKRGRPKRGEKRPKEPTRIGPDGGADPRGTPRRLRRGEQEEQLAGTRRPGSATSCTSTPPMAPFRSMRS
jgi:hypothetical protein